MQHPFTLTYFVHRNLQRIQRTTANSSWTNLHPFRLLHGLFENVFKEFIVEFDKMLIFGEDMCQEDANILVHTFHVQDDSDFIKIALQQNPTYVIPRSTRRNEQYVTSAAKGARLENQFDKM